MKENHYCSKHNSCDGFTDGTGKWNCWVCYKEDRFLNPPGEVFLKCIMGNNMVRVLTYGKRLLIEIWNIKNKKLLLWDRQYDYLSQASRDYDRILLNLEKTPPVLSP